MLCFEYKVTILRPAKEFARIDSLVMGQEMSEPDNLSLPGAKSRADYAGL